MKIWKISYVGIQDSLVMAVNAKTLEIGKRDTNLYHIQPLSNAVKVETDH